MPVTFSQPYAPGSTHGESEPSSGPPAQTETPKGEDMVRLDALVAVATSEEKAREKLT